jgi:hypothetical protein
MSKEGTADMRKRVTLTMPQELEIIMSLAKGENCSVIVAAHTPVDHWLSVIQGSKY